MIHVTRKERIMRNTVANPQDCPAGSEASAHYKWQDGRFVRDGWVCEIRSNN